MRVLAESKNFKVYSLEESIYLRDKRLIPADEEFSKKDKFVDSHYGNPTGAIFIHPENEKFIAISGCGISIFSIENGKVSNFLNEKDDLRYTNGIHQDLLDDQILEFRFVGYNESNELRVFKMNIESKEISVLE